MYVINTKNGDDTFYNKDGIGRHFVSLGGGNDRIDIYGQSNVITPGSGNDEVFLTLGENSIHRAKNIIYKNEDWDFYQNNGTTVSVEYPDINSKDIKLIRKLQNNTIALFMARPLSFGGKTVLSLSLVPGSDNYIMIWSRDLYHYTFTHENSETGDCDTYFLDFRSYHYKNQGKTAFTLNIILAALCICRNICQTKTTS